MGIKGDHQSKLGYVLAEQMIEKLEPIGEITSKKMFGGYGLFHDETMFGMIDSNGVLFFKGDEELRVQLTKLGSAKHRRMPYYSLPQEVVSNFDLLIEIAIKSIEFSK